MVFYDEIPLFVDTNLGTHFALSVSQDITAGDLKGKLEMEHFSCFPNLGKIQVHGLMVKKKTFFYHLSDSMAIKHVFKDLSGKWLLHLDACQKPASLDVTDPVEANQRTENREVKPTSGRQSKHACGKAVQNEISTVSEHPIEGKEHECSSILEKYGNSQTISVTGIISRFFSELDEVDSCYCRPKYCHEAVQVHMDTQCSFAKMGEESTAEGAEAALKMKLQQIGSRKLANKNSSICASHISRSKSSKYQVGKRVVQAADSIRISGNGKRPATKFLSKLKVNSSDSALFIRRTAFDADDFAD